MITVRPVLADPATTTGRTLGEVIQIGEDVTVRVMDVNGQQVRLGFDVPGTIAIVREELERTRGPGSDDA